MTTPIYDERILSDLHKDAHGFRPVPGFFAHWDSLSVEERNREWTMLCDLVEQNMDADAASLAHAIERFEATLDSLVLSLGVPFPKALEWDMEAHDVQGDLGFYLWHYGITSFDYEARLRERMGG